MFLLASQFVGSISTARTSLGLSALSQAQYHEVDVFFSGFKKNVNLGLSFYVSFGIGGSIHIVSFYWSLES